MDLTMKNDDNDYWRYTVNYAIYQCKNDEYTPKNDFFFFFDKTMKPYSETVILSI